MKPSPSELRSKIAKAHSWALKRRQVFLVCLIESQYVVVSRLNYQLWPKQLSEKIYGKTVYEISPLMIYDVKTKQPHFPTYINLLDH